MPDVLIRPVSRPKGRPRGEEGSFPGEASPFENAGPRFTPEVLEGFYARYTVRPLADTDPVGCLYAYPCLLDREIAALLASSLAYGRVKQILRSVQGILCRLGPSPRAFLEEAGEGLLREVTAEFCHRFTTSEELLGFFLGVQRAIRRHGSLEHCFLSHWQKGPGDVVQALGGFSLELRGPCSRVHSLLPDPWKGGACKRLHLFLRWMVRHDAIDPGGWEGVGRESLLVPLDTHMHRLGLSWGLTRRKAPDLRTAREITGAFRAVCPRDPVRYDFALTRIGILGLTPPTQTSRRTQSHGRTGATQAADPGDGQDPFRKGDPHGPPLSPVEGL